MSSRQENADRGQYIRQQRAQQLVRQAESQLEAACEAAEEAFAENNYSRVRELLAEFILPAFDLAEYELPEVARNATQSNQTWNIGAVQMLTRCNGRRELRAVDDATLESGFRSITTALSLGGRIDGEATTTVPAYEYQHQVGERYYRPLSAGSDELEMANTGDWEATLLTGGQGSGKTASRFTITEDRIANGHKVVDLVDMFKAENAMYDIESRNDNLDRIREDAGADVGFQGEYEPPEMEVLLPLTHELADSEVPFDTDAEQFTARPFVIPASELTYRQLVMLLPHTTKTQENYLRSAHQILTERDGDWTLRDVAETVRKYTNASESVADRIERALETAQSKSFIRDEESDHCLDWDRIMANPGTVTSFSVYMLREKSDKLAITSWLLDSLYQARLDLLRKHAVEEYPPLTVNIGEAHKVAPRQKAEQDAEATIEGDMIDTFSELIALMRHVNMEIVADTQKFKQQLSSSVSSLFHRVFAFAGQKPDIKKVFRTRVDNTNPAETVATFDPGKCALVSGDGYSMPIQMLPPRMHHLDAKHDGDGLGARARYLDHEELRPAPWESTIPPRLRFSDMDRGPVAEFIYQHVELTGSNDDLVVKQEMTDAFNDWYLTDYGGEAEQAHNAVCKLIKRKTDIEDGERQVEGYDIAKSVWVGVVVTYDPEAEDESDGSNRET